MNFKVSFEDALQQFQQSNSIIDAILVIFKWKRSQTKDKFSVSTIIDLTALISFSFCLFKYFKSKAKNSKLEKKIKYLHCQKPLSYFQAIEFINKINQDSDQMNLVEMLMNPQVSALTQSLYQLKKTFCLGIIQHQENKPVLLGTTTISINSNNLIDQNYQQLLRQRLFPLETNPAAQFHVKDDQGQIKVQARHFTKNSQYLVSILPDLHLMQPKLEATLKKLIDRKYIFNRFLQTAFFERRQVLEGSKIHIKRLRISFPNEVPICILCDLMLNVTTKSARAIKIRAIGSTFEELKHYLLNYYETKIDRNNLLQKLLLVAAAGIFGIFIMLRLRKFYQKVQVYQISREYPRIDEINKPITHAIVQSQLNQQLNESDLVCTNCILKQGPTQKVKNIIFIPCYHFQCCKQCFEEENPIKCLTCDQKIYSGISVFYG